MDDRPSGLRAFLNELKRRKVYRVAVAYAAGAFVVWQAAEIALPALGFPDAALRFVVVASLLGFPVAVVLAWIYELRPDPETGSGGLGGRLGGWPLAAGAVVLLTAAFAAFWVLRDHARPTDQRRLAIFPFSARSPDGASLGEGVADLVAVGLDGTPGFTVVDPRALWPPVLAASASPSLVSDEARYAARSRAFDASHFVTGTVLEAGETVQVSLRVYESVGGTPVGSIRASAPADSLGRLVDQLAVDLVATLWHGAAIPAVGSVDQHATSSPQALNAYLEAMAHVRRGRFDEATVAIERAVAEDSTFALAHLQHFRIRSWVLALNGQPLVGLRDIIDRAMAYRDRLSPRNRLRVEAARAMDGTDALRAASLNERIVEIDPSDADAWASLAYLRANDAWILRRRFQEAGPTLERAIALDSLNVPLLYLRGLLELALPDTAAARATAEALDDAGAGGPIPDGFRAALAVLTAPEPALDSVIRTVAEQPAGPVIGVIRITRMVDLERAHRLARFLRDSADQATHRRLGFGAALQITAARGDAVRVDSLVHTSSATPGLRAAGHRYVVAMALAGIGIGDPEVSRHAVEALEALAPVDSLAEAVETREEAWAAAWAVGSFHAAQGDSLVGVAYRDALLAMDVAETSTVPRWAESLAHDVDARLAARRGDGDAALEAARRAYDLWVIHNADEGGWYPEPGLRFQLAERLSATGRHADAEWYYRSFLPPHWTSFYTVLAREAVEGMERGEG